MSYHHYIYLIQEREFVNTGEEIYKIGKTTQESLNRYLQYPRGSKLLLHISCNDCHMMEKKILSIFNMRFTQQKQIGIEYFIGSKDEMIQIIFQCIYPELKTIKPKIDFNEYIYKP